MHLVGEVIVHVRRVPIRLKLGATLLVPVLALIAVAGLEMLSAAREVRDVHDQAEVATATLGPPSLLRHIELERNANSTYLLGTEDSVALTVENKEQAWEQTDAAIEDFRAMVEAEGGFLAEQYQPALDALDNIEGLRQQVRDYTGERSPNNNPMTREVFDGYSEIMDALYAANAQVVPTIANSDLRRGAELADLAAHQRDTTARVLRVLLRAQFEGAKDGVNDPQEVADLARVLGTLRRNAETIQTKAEGPYEELADKLFATEHIQQYPEVLQDILDTGVVEIGLVLNTSTGSEPGKFGYSVFSAEVNDQLRADADDVRADADARLRTYGVLALLALLVALATTWLVSKSLTRPLRSLTQQATDMAKTRLPNAVRGILNTPLGEDVEIPRVEPVRVKTRDEVGDVADALNTVQETALELAVEQAVLRRNIADSFVNLGRRNQNLLGRQLDFITELEANETDPDTLASLFRLDHLATRMRRNAESLLVLAGIDPPRRWSAPVRLNDVIRAALGEVEDYQRVSVVGVEPATVVGSAAADLAHLLAEFIENALTFSPPDQNVEVRGRHREGGYTLAIIDNGFGMAPEDIERANRRLAGSESFTVAPSKYLGHYVAGNLAARHEVKVRLEQSPGSGVTATIHLSPELVAGPDVNGRTEGEQVASVPLPAEGRNGKLPVGAGIGGNGSGAAGAATGNGHGIPAAAQAGPDTAAASAVGLNGLPGNGDGPGVHPLMPTLNAGPVPLAPGFPAALATGGPDARALPTGDPAAGEPEPGPAGVPGAGAEGQAPPLPSRGTPAGAGRTASGLTKRSPRNPATAAAVPHGELLDALSRHSRNANGPVGLSPAAPLSGGPASGRPPLPSRPTARHGGPAGQPGPSGPGGIPAGPIPGVAPAGPVVGAPGGPGGPSGAGGPGAPGSPGAGGRGPGGPGSFGGPDGPGAFGIPGSPGGPATGPGVPDAPAARAPIGQPGQPGRPGHGLGGADGGAPGGPVPGPPRAPGGRAVPGGPAARATGGMGGPARPAAGSAAPAWAALDRLSGANARGPGRQGDPGTGGLTSSGLARRVPGANLPAGGLHTIRRSEADAAAAAPPPAPAPVAPPPRDEASDDESHERAESVYTLLTSFTVGVQRGLDETSTTPPPGTPGDEGDAKP
jgi:signal transduction histidine kinase